jgi:hypothetical protein
MTKKIIPQRTRFFFAVEGEGEQSFVKWLQELSDQQEMHVHLDPVVLGGGGYRSMLANAVRYRERKERKKAKAAILLLDADRAARDDRWTIDKLREEATQKSFNLCVQSPNQEGVLFRMLSGNERLQPNLSTVHRQLLGAWPEYKKPVDTRALSAKFTLQDLLRVAQIDSELRMLLQTIGLMQI